ncbi:hypothetical protein [Micromonospora echinospora]|uniref:hypothetical protein n=1 Tax=Micromonospora echinospora TaxID=1877 RepID=UPI003670FC61
MQIILGGTNTQSNALGSPPGSPVTAPDSGQPTGSGAGRGRPRLTRRTVRILAVAAMAMALLGGAGHWWSSRGESSPPPTRSPTPTPTRTDSPRTWSARITNTPNGTFGYPGPFADPRHRQPAASFFEGNLLRIVCQERNGRLITDRTDDVQSTVWYRLETGIWVSSLYTDLPQGDAGRPSPGIPDCTY